MFRDGDEILIQSRDEKPLNRYFPELMEPLRSALPARCVLDGEIVIVKNNGLDFDALQLRLHPAASRVKLLSRTDAGIDLSSSTCSAVGDRDLRGEPFQSRRRMTGVAACIGAQPPIHLTPATTDRSIAADWFRRFEGAGLDGVMAKPSCGNLRAEQARDAQSETRARLRLRCCGIPLAQERRAQQWSARSCSASSTMPALCNTSASARASVQQNDKSWWNFSSRIAKMRCRSSVEGLGRERRNRER